MKHIVIFQLQVKDENIEERPSQLFFSGFLSQLLKLYK